MPIESMDDLDRLERAVRNPPDSYPTYRIPAGVDVWVAKDGDGDLWVRWHRMKYDLFFVDFLFQACPVDPKQKFRMRGDLPYKNRALRFIPLTGAEARTVKDLESDCFIVVGTGNPSFPFVICPDNLVQPKPTGYHK